MGGPCGQRGWINQTNGLDANFGGAETVLAASSSDGEDAVGDSGEANAGGRAGPGALAWS